MEVLDYIVSPFIIFAVMLIAFSVRASNYSRDKIMSKFFMRGLLFHIIGSVGFCFIYLYYYRGGDTLVYFHWIHKWAAYFGDKPSMALSFVLTPDILAYNDFKYYGDFNYTYMMAEGSNEVFFIKIASVVNLLSFNTFISTSIVFGCFAFYGSWKLYRTLCEIFPDFKQQMGMALFYVPSVIFWSSGIMKDTICFGFSCLLIHASYQGLIRGRSLPKYILLAVVSAYMVARIKPYIVLALTPAIIYWVFNSMQNRISSSSMRSASTPVFILLSAGVALIFMSAFGESLGKYSVDSLETTATGFQTWHSVAKSENGATYSLGDNTPGFTLRSLLIKFPLAINVTFFRPYLFEANSLMILVSAIESTIIMFYTLRVLFRTRLGGFFSTIFANPTLTFLFTYSMIFGFAVGLTSYNFGALVRYKIPCMPPFIILLILTEGVYTRFGADYEAAKLRRRTNA